MTRAANIVTQALLLICQLVNQFFDLIPPDYKTAALIAIAGLQGIVAIIAHAYNPDGSTAYVAYRPGATPAPQQAPRPGKRPAPLAMLLLLIGIMCFSVSCATLDADRAKLRTVTTEDVQAALTIAQQHQDAAGVQCYTYLLTRLKAPDAPPTVKGLVSAFELARVTVEGGQDRLDALNVACAALVTDAAATIARLAARFGL